MRSLRPSRPLRAVRTMAIATTMAAAALAVGATPAYAGFAPFTVTPDPVAPGGTLSIHGINCSGSGGTVALELFAGDFSGTNVEPGGPTVDNVDVTPDGSGVWNGTMTAPATAMTGDRLTVWARCTSAINNFTYNNVAVSVLAPGGPTTTTTTAAPSCGPTTTAAPTTTSTSTTTTLVSINQRLARAADPSCPTTTTTTTPAVAPATAVPARPTFTG